MLAKSMRITALLAVIGFFHQPALAGPAAQGAEDLDEALTLKTTDLENGIDVYEVCGSCHLLEGWGKPDGTFPQLSGQHASVIIKEMKAIRVKDRIAPTMYPFTEPRQLGSAQDIADMAAYIEQLPMNPKNGVGPGADLARGETLYKQACAACHGQTGEGNAAAAFPRIHGQHYNYLVTQVKVVRDGGRKNANAGMAAVVKGLSDKDVEAVADYVSRLKPPAERLGHPGWQNPDYD